MSKTHTHDNIHTVDDLVEHNIRSIANLEEAARGERTTADRLVDAISSFCGSMNFVVTHALWFGIWVVINHPAVTPEGWQFDPYPYQFLTFVVSLEAIFLATFILITQNRQSRIADRRNHLDLQINLLSEQENTKMLSMLDAIQKKLGIHDRDPDVKILEEGTDPDRLAQEIRKTFEKQE